ncbi:MAG: sigma 54-interacting transcriptional regulator [Clostridiales bacterium]|jgi:transcriptional regulator with PAS, ATPase and Fis domain|nr:sigma 54-interacting transcriptional regulator [Clostridiales bacterium]
MQFHLDIEMKEICNQEILVINNSVDLTEAESLLREGNEQLLVVLKNKKPQMIYMVMGNKAGKSAKIEQIHAYEIIEGTQPLKSVIDMFTRCSVALVVDKKKGPCGFLTHGMLTKLLAVRLEELRQYFLTVLEGSGEIIIITDDQLKALYLNQKAESFYNIKKEDVIGHNLMSFFPSVVLKDVLFSGVPVQESYHQPKPGLYVLINSLPVKAGDRLVGGVSLEQDITRMVNLNKEVTKANSKLSFLQKEIDKIHSDEGKAFSGIHGHSPRLKEVVSVANKVALTNAAVLIRGESGTGKELFARAIHKVSRRRECPFIAINCGAIPPNLFESELFGYDGGAFTGADKKGKKGAFELADGGTLFLDEIGEMQYTMQVKLLRVLQENVFFRVGGAKEVKVNVRIVAATNKDLEKMVEEGVFRRDLYYRLNVVSMEIPPLRERKGDIPELVYEFINEYSQSHNKKVDDISSDLMAAFLKYNWPGNVRELRNIIERLVILTEGNLINKDYLPPLLLEKLKHKTARESQDILLDTATKNVEREIIMKTLRDVRGNKTKAAQVLGIPRSTLYYRLHTLGLLGEE